MLSCYKFCIVMLREKLSAALFFSVTGSYTVYLQISSVSGTVLCAVYFNVLIVLLSCLLNILMWHYCYAMCFPSLKSQ